MNGYMQPASPATPKKSKKPKQVSRVETGVSICLYYMPPRCPKRRCERDPKVLVKGTYTSKEGFFKEVRHAFDSLPDDEQVDSKVVLRVGDDGRKVRWADAPRWAGGESESFIAWLEKKILKGRSIPAWEVD